MDSQIESILTFFEQINAIPRCSKHEAHIGQWLEQWAEGHGWQTHMDSAGNLIVQVPASIGYEDRPEIIIQGHMDMVCEKTPESPHDFNTDPIVGIVDGDWLRADRTTLGADNGIAIAYAMAIAEDTSLAHPPLTLLFTVDEETGLNGVKDMAPGVLKAKLLINLDSEDEGVFTIGCAGGEDSIITLTPDTAPLAQGDAIFTIVVGGLRGGHSGIDIDKQRGNANKVMARVLTRLQTRCTLRLITVNGGTRHNAIARDASAQVACPPDAADQVQQVVAQLADSIQQELEGVDPDLFITCQIDATEQKQALTLEESRRIVALLHTLPHGVASMSLNLEGLVETSSNLAVVEITPQQCTIHTSQRSAVASRLAEITATVHAAAHLAGAQVRDENQYPPWPPDLQAPLLRQSKQTYTRLFSKEPKVEVIHAGLECAIIGDQYPGMQMISFGPTIENPHSPTERLNIPSVEKVWCFLVALLAALEETPATNA